MSPEVSSVSTWIAYGAPGMLALVLYFVGRAGIKLLDRFADSIDKLERTIAALHLHVQTTAVAEAASVERRHAELLAAIERSAKETRHDIRNAIQFARMGGDVRESEESA